MLCYQKMYLHLFNRVIDAVQELEAGHITRALETLLSAQAECEEIYLEIGDGDAPSL